MVLEYGESEFCLERIVLGVLGGVYGGCNINGSIWHFLSGRINGGQTKLWVSGIVVFSRGMRLCVGTEVYRFDNFGFDGGYFGGDSLYCHKLSETCRGERARCRWRVEQSYERDFDEYLLCVAGGGSSCSCSHDGNEFGIGRGQFEGKVMTGMFHGSNVS